jgi:DNA-directed RNA polymerase subunit beta'
MLEVNDFDAVRISLASPEQIRSWSYGEVTKPETINYRTLKPERDGLFCERIFGPTKDYECACGKYKRIRFKGIICDKCEVEVARAKVRRERMGHIELACPVSHIWFAKGIPSRLGLLLDLSARSLERVLYFSHFIITSVDEARRDEMVKKIESDSEAETKERAEALETKIAAAEENKATVEEINRLRREAEEEAEAEDEEEEEEPIGIEQLKDLQKGVLLTETQYADLKEKFGDVFEAGMGAEAILKIVREIELDKLRSDLLNEAHSTSGQRRKKARKQLQLVEAFRHSGNKPDWMILTVLPVLPPDLRPMVQLDGGRFATSDLNDLYRRVINRNNRLQHLMEIEAPEIIVRNEKRMLQEAVDSLIDNGRRSRTVSANGNHKLKSLSDILRGKQGRFRQNLLGKRVDYSGRSVIVVGPYLKLNQCGLPRRMALELFKPFIMRELIRQGLAHNIKNARRLVERAKPEVYDILEEVVKERPVLLNRAPTLHRLSIQAFEPVLIDGSAIQLHPLVCSAFNADFDGDQMAVHIPLSRAAVKEARDIMLSTHNMLLPSSGEPTVIPTLDIVLGCYYLTAIEKKDNGKKQRFSSFADARLAFDLNHLRQEGVRDELKTEAVGLREEIDVRDPEGKVLSTTVGRIIFNEILPKELGYQNKQINKGALKKIVVDCYGMLDKDGNRVLDNDRMAQLLDAIKGLGFHYATVSGTTIALYDLKVPENKKALLEDADKRVGVIEAQYHRGLITDDERYGSIIKVWMGTTKDITDSIEKNIDQYGGISIIASSGAKGNISQITQMAGMRGLMTDPSGKIIEFPIKSSLCEGHTALEYFLSTHGARKGLADTALRTSDSGYLTRRLIDVSQDVIVRIEDCGTQDGIWVEEPKEKGFLPAYVERIRGRLAAAPIANPATGEVIVDRNGDIDEQKANEILAAGIKRVYVRSPLTCAARQGICQKCYGRDLARRQLVELNTAVGIIAAQSIGEPGTQLTLRTFHTGGVVGLDITSGLPRVKELFEARTPKAKAEISEIDGKTEVTDNEGGNRKIKITYTEPTREEFPLPPGYHIYVTAGQMVDVGTVLAGPDVNIPSSTELTTTSPNVVSTVVGEITIEDGQIVVAYEEKEEREYPVTGNVHILVKPGDEVTAGQQLTDGSIDPQDILSIMGREAVQRYLVDEVQKVYRSQGVNIDDRHIEVIAHQMLSKVRIDSSGDTELVPGELIDRFKYEDINAKVLAEGGEPATAHTVLLGITRASLSTESWLAAASFQETTRVLTDAAIYGKIDRLVGLKENVIIGKIIPAQHITPDDFDEPLDTLTPALAGAESPDLEEEEEGADELKREHAVARGGAHLEADKDEELEDEAGEEKESEDEGKEKKEE